MESPQHMGRLFFNGAFTLIGIGLVLFTGYLWLKKD